jgi:flagellar motility protein MotE (MotC chaperone)
MLRAKLIIAGMAAVLAVSLVAAPARHGYSMSTLKTWVNKARPGTFPELETGKQAQPPPEIKAKPSQEALTDTERKILLSLMERKRQLDERDTLLNQREEQLRVLRDNIQQQVAELKRLQSEIEASMEAKRQQDAENLQKVVNLYNGMDPGKAAEKLKTLEPKVAVQILMGMNQRKAAQLLEALPPDSAKRITEAIVSKVPTTQ